MSLVLVGAITCPRAFACVTRESSRCVSASTRCSHFTEVTNLPYGSQRWGCQVFFTVMWPLRSRAKHTPRYLMIASMSLFKRNVAGATAGRCGCSVWSRLTNQPQRGNVMVAASIWPVCVCVCVSAAPVMFYLPAWQQHHKKRIHLNSITAKNTHNILLNYRSQQNLCIVKHFQ